jgi:uncharacterized protein (DUF305 family)
MPRAFVLTIFSLFFVTTNCLQIHKYMAGRIKLLKGGLPINEDDVPAFEVSYVPPGPFDQQCGTYGLDAFQLPNPVCPDRFVCGAEEQDEELQAFADCIDAMDCHMLSGMTTGVKASNEAALFIHQMIPHHQNAVNMAKALLKSGKVVCDDLTNEDSQDCILERILREIVNGQNHQIQLMNAYLEAKEYLATDNCVVEVETLGSSEEQIRVDLGTACDYTILAKSGISTVPTSAITGNIGVSPIAATAITGFELALDSAGQFSTALQINGQAHAADYGGNVASGLTVAVLDMEAAYTDAAGRPNVDATKINLKGGDISSLTLTPGVYTFNMGISFNKDIYFDAYGNDNAVFILQTTGNLLQAAGTRVILQGGARAENIFWQVAGNVKVMAGSHLEGVLLVKTDVTFITGSSLNGLILAQTAVNLQMATITQPTGTCTTTTVAQP